MVQYGDSTVYSSIGDSHLRHPGKLRRVGDMYVEVERRLITAMFVKLS